MALLDLSNSNPQAFKNLTIEQIVKIAGSGDLRDNSACSVEFREFLAQLPDSENIRNYVEQCLASSFPKRGMVLQDLVNELGRRLDYHVDNGLYQGTINKVGFDGLWKSPEGHAIIVEVKTTDTFGVTLATVIGYRDKLRGSGAISDQSSILIVVGDLNTDDLESQVRGSRYAWDVRLISAVALGKLAQMKEEAAGPETGQRIRDFLVPMEYTRLDRMIDVMFTATKGTEEAAKEAIAAEPAESDKKLEKSPHQSSDQQTTEPENLNVIKEKIIAAIGHAKGIKFLKKSSALYWDAQHSSRLACALSRRHEQNNYWYGYHQTWDEFLEPGSVSLIALGCVGASFALLLPWGELHPLLTSLTTTNTPTGTRWHLRVAETAAGHHVLVLAAGAGTFSLDQYKIDVS